MKRRKVWLAVLTGSLLLGTCMCARAEEAVTEEAMEAATESAAEEETEAAYEYVELGDRPAYKALDYVTLGQYKDLPIEIDPIVITDEQVDTAVRNALEVTATEMVPTPPESFIMLPPKKLAMPVSKMVRVRPVTFWLTLRVTVRKA